MSSQWLEKLSLARTVPQFVSTLEELGTALPGVETSFFYQYDGAQHRLRRLGQEFGVDEQTQPGCCALYREVIEGPGALPDDQQTVHLSVPVRHFGELVGVFSVASSGNGALKPHLIELARVAGVVCENVRQRQESAAYLDRSRDLLVRAVEAVSKEGTGHVGRVVRLSSELANLLDLSAQSRADLFAAAHYHDIGMLMVPSHSGFEAERAHPRAAAEFLAASNALRDLAPLVLAHHERYDGTGFPDGKSGDDVPIEGWILALAEDLDEFWQASYKTDFRENLADFFARRVAGHHPDVVDALCGLADSGRLAALYDNSEQS
ncbi:MAG: HD-GYP domain-containing protein [Vulcanimicrobiota bacterium]